MKRDKIMKKILFLFISLQLLLPVIALAVPPQHHLYIGAFIGPDKNNSSQGGWDNDLSYSVDREMVNWQGKNFAFEQTYMSVDYDVQNLDELVFLELESIWYYGRVPMVNLTYDAVQHYSQTVGCTETFVELSSNLSNPSSSEYQRLVLWAQGLKRWLDLGSSRFLVLAFLQEPNFSFCAKDNDPSTWAFVDPDASKSSFRKGRAIVESVVGTNAASRIQWAFAPTNESNGFMPGFEAYYPGDDVVDWVGLSAYNIGGYTIPQWIYPWQSFDDMARPYLDRMRALAPRKPLAIFQTGSVSFGGDKNQWIQKFIQDALSYPKLYLLLYFNTIVPYDNGFPQGMDWPVFWNDPYSASLLNGYGPLTSVSHNNMRYTGWLTAIQNPNSVFSSVSMPAAGKFGACNWDVVKCVAPIGNNYNLLPELRDRNAINQYNGITNWEVLASGLDPLSNNIQSTETDCHDGIDNDANGRTDEDDTFVCGDLTLAEGVVTDDNILSQDEYRYFQFLAPGSSRVDITITDIGGAAGDVDLYVMKNGRPTLTSYDYRSVNAGKKNETVSINVPESGIWHVLVYGKQVGPYKIRVRNQFAVTPQIGNIKNVVACDIDHNGQDDLIFSIANFGFQAYENNDKWLNLLADGTTPSTMGCGDIEGDGVPKIIGVWSGSNLLKEFSTATWSWQNINVPPGGVPGSLIVKDTDGDGMAEIIGLFKQSNALKLRRGSTGLWEDMPRPPSVTSAPDEIVGEKIRNDEDPSIAGVWRTQGQVRIFSFAKNSWTNISLPFSAAPDILKVGDVDNDGLVDLAGVWRSSYISTQVRSGFTGQWVEIQAEAFNTPDSQPALIELADVDADNKEDVVSVWANAWAQTKIYLQSWPGWELVYLGSPSFIAAGNFDGDPGGRKDVALIWSDHIKIWTNNTTLEDVEVDSFFADVPQGYWSLPWIERLYNAGITSGCSVDDSATPANEAQYCPDNPVTRAQMAVFLEKGKNGGSYLPPPAAGIFADVPIAPAPYWAANWIEQFYKDGITSGCLSSPLSYCPDNPVTRAQMAVFLLRIKHGPAYAPPAATGAMFNDVTAGTFAASWIEELAVEGITSGCGGGNYCPDSPVTRAQMAVFLVRVFDLP